MSTNVILRKYLDILNEAEDVKNQAASEPVAGDGAMPDPQEQITYAPVKGEGSIKEVIEAVKKFQGAVGLEETGVIDPKTLAEILSQSGQLGKEEMAKLSAGAKEAETTEPVAEGLEGRGKHDMISDKAALHLGYAHGLMGEMHQCAHPVGSSAHSHYSHGHHEGLKECGVLSSPMGAATL